jgi:hypothetical protein
VGFFNLKKFLASQKCAWINRAFKLQVDNWRYDMKSSSPNMNILTVRKADFNKKTNPLLYDIAEAYESFYCDFSNCDGNYKTAYIYENDAFTLGPRDGGRISAAFFGQNFYNRHKNEIRKLTFENCFSNNRIKTCGEFADAGLPLTPTIWFKLCGAVSFWKTKFVCEKNPVKIENFFAGIKKGSKKLRLVSESVAENKINLLATANVRTFFQLVGVECSAASCKIWIGAWNKNFLPNELRNFMFNCRNNTLPLNNRLNSYMKEIDPRCTFCRIKFGTEAARDGFAHCFLLCPTVKQFLTTLIVKLNLELDLDDNEFRQLYWYGYSKNTEKVDVHTLIFFECFRFTVYKIRLKRTLPNYNRVEKEFSTLILKLCKVNKKFKTAMETSKLFENFLPALG